MRPRRAPLSRVHRDCPDAGVAEEVGHEVRVSLRYAEPESARAAQAVVLVQGILRSRLGGNRVGQLLLVEAGAAPGDVLVVDVVGNAVVVEGAQQSAADPLRHVAAVDEIVAAEREQITAVRALRSGGKAEQELRLEVAEHPAIRPRGRVVEFVDHDVVELVRVEAVQVLLTTQRLNGREEHVGVRRLLSTRVVAQRRHPAGWFGTSASPERGSPHDGR